MMDYPRLKSALRILSRPGGAERLLLTEQKAWAIRSAVEVALLPLLDGTRTISQIAAAMKPASARDILGALHWLRKEGFLDEGSPHPPVDDPPDLSGIRNVLSVSAFGDYASSVWEKWQASGFRASEHEGALRIVLTDDYLRDDFRDFMKRDSGICIPVRVSDTSVWIGPVPGGEGHACWECLATRLRGNRNLWLFAKEQGICWPPAPGTAMFALRALAPFLASAAAADALRGRLRVYDAAGGPFHIYPVTRRPQCASCGNPAAAKPPIELRASLHGVVTEAGLRVETPAQAWDRLCHHVNPLTGIVNRIQKVPESGGLHVYTAKAYPVRPFRTWEEALDSERFYAGGKGTTDEQARVSALAEALERYSSVYTGEEPYEAAPFADVADRAIPPPALALFSDAQYASRPAESPKRFNRIPLPFDDQVPIAWTRVWSFTRQDWRLLPTSFCYMGAPASHPSRYCFGDSNGNAAGTCLEDAVLQGFLELVERDASAIWWYNRLRCPGVSLEGIDDVFVGQMVESHRKLGREIWLLDITSDFEIPTFFAVSRETQGGDRLCSGMGSHYDPRIAALRALTEVNQMLPHILQHAEREDRRADRPGESLLTIRAEDHPFLMPDPTRPLRTMNDFPRWPFDDLSAALRQSMERVHQRGMEFLVHDLTRPDIGLPVVKVIVPGMRLHWRRTAPGRLYDVPVALGRLARPNRESELNPLDLSG